MVIIIIIKRKKKVGLKVMLHGTIATTIFSAEQRYSIVATLFRMVATLFQHCNAVLH